MSNLFGTATVDDLEGERTMLATVERIIEEGDTFSLDRHLLPGLSRVFRRALKGDQLVGLLHGFGGALGRPLDASALTINGPAVLLTPIAIY